MAEIVTSGMSLNQGRIALNQFLTGSTFALSATTNQSILNINSITSVASGVIWGFGLGKGNGLTSGAYTTVLNGSGNTASNNFSLIGNGRSNTVSDAYSTVINGKNNRATSTYTAVVNGANNLANASMAAILTGNYNKIYSFGNASSISGGFRNKITNSVSFIGNGSNNTISAIYGAIAGGYYNSISTPYGFIGSGLYNAVSGMFSSSLNGSHNTSSGSYSITLGGKNNVASHDHTIAIGKSAASDGTYRMVFSAGAGNTIKFDFASGNGYFDGGADIGNADYGEYFEWADGNLNNEKRYGFAVSLIDNGKIEIGNYNIIGIISSVPGIIGDSAELSWKNKYKTDEWGIIQQEEFYKYTIIRKNEKDKNEIIIVWVDKEGNQYSSEVRNSLEKTNKILKNKFSFTEEEEDNKKIIKIDLFSEGYDSSKSYIPRSQRSEYGVVGLLGKLRVRTAENINSKFIDFNSNGMAINGTKYRVIEKIKEYDGEYGIIKIFFK